MGWIRLVRLKTSIHPLASSFLNPTLHRPLRLKAKETELKKLTK